MAQFGSGLRSRARLTALVARWTEGIRFAKWPIIQGCRISTLCVRNSGWILFRFFPSARRIPKAGIQPTRRWPCVSRGLWSNHAAVVRRIYTSRASRNRSKPRKARAQHGKADRFADSRSGHTAHGRLPQPRPRWNQLQKCREPQASLLCASKCPRRVSPSPNPNAIWRPGLGPLDTVSPAWGRTANSGSPSFRPVDGAATLQDDAI